MPSPLYIGNPPQNLQEYPKNISGKYTIYTLRTCHECLTEKPAGLPRYTLRSCKTSPAGITGQQKAVNIYPRLLHVGLSGPNKILYQLAQNSFRQK
jgi:hypothetical protein